MKTLLRAIGAGLFIFMASVTGLIAVCRELGQDKQAPPSGNLFIASAIVGLCGAAVIFLWNLIELCDGDEV